MTDELRQRLIKNLSSMEEGDALRQTLEEYIYEVGNVTNIPKEILNGDKERLAEEIIGRTIAKQYLDELLKNLKFTPQKEVVKKIIR
jgi:hypothetical protein